MTLRGCVNAGHGCWRGCEAVGMEVTDIFWLPVYSVLEGHLRVDEILRVIPVELWLVDVFQ